MSSVYDIPPPKKGRKQATPQSKVKRKISEEPRSKDVIQVCGVMDVIT
jgi:hypothetical protein